MRESRGDPAGVYRLMTDLAESRSAVVSAMIDGTSQSQLTLAKCFDPLHLLRLCSFASEYKNAETGIRY